ncbi:hypothetical protein TNCV_4680661 [Trichonephila clavipes]|nr:hypothetical protein TNCV_4680661 [Trichonephila clavipes]
MVSLNSVHCCCMEGGRDENSEYWVANIESENASQAAEIVNGVYRPDTITVNYLQFRFRGFRSGIFDVKDAPRTSRPVVKNGDKIS